MIPHPSRMSDRWRGRCAFCGVICGVVLWCLVAWLLLWLVAGCLLIPLRRVLVHSISALGDLLSLWAFCFLVRVEISHGEVAES